MAFDWRYEQQVVSDNTTDVETVTPPGGAQAFMLSIEGSDARITLAGGAPSSILGHKYAADLPAVLVLSHHPFKAASVDASPSTLNITWGYS